MSEEATEPPKSPADSKLSATKDRSCPYCGQAFTSSSLGRHLDLYIKEKNPKAPDGIHDVDAIRKLRGSITRRQPRGSLARRASSNPSTPTASSQKSPPPDPATVKPPIDPRDASYNVDPLQPPKFPFPPSWEATGVMNDIPARNADPRPLGWDDGAAAESTPTTVTQHAPSRAVQKQQLDARQKLVDAMDTARAAELALREVLSSWRAAKLHIGINSLPFDFDPLSLDFPALTLHCLDAPPTLFSSTPHPTSTSWSINPPAHKQYEALQRYFYDEFRKWRTACAVATTATSEELTYPPSDSHFPKDVRQDVRTAEKAASLLENQISEHLQSTYQVWQQLSAQRKSDLWGLELARSVGRRQKDVERHRETLHLVRQENANLKTQIDQLNRLQQPREFRIVPPATIPIDEPLLTFFMDQSTKGSGGIGLNREDRHADLGTLVSRAIERWKTVVVSSRGMGGQKTFDQAAPTLTPTSATSGLLSTPQLKPTGPQHHHPHQRPFSGPTPNASVDGSRSTPMTTPAPTCVVNNENSDQDADADAEMEEDDDFPPITPGVTQPAAHHHLSQLEVPRARDRSLRAPSNHEGRYRVNGTDVERAPIIRHSMSNSDAVSSGQGRATDHPESSRKAHYQPVQGVGVGDPMHVTEGYSTVK